MIMHQTSTFMQYINTVTFPEKMLKLMFFGGFHVGGDCFIRPRPLVGADAWDGRQSKEFKVWLHQAYQEERSGHVWGEENPQAELRTWIYGGISGVYIRYIYGFLWFGGFYVLVLISNVLFWLLFVVLFEGFFVSFGVLLLAGLPYSESVCYDCCRSNLFIRG